jgi:hypothetical protein
VSSKSNDERVKKHHITSHNCSHKEFERNDQNRTNVHGSI